MSRITVSLLTLLALCGAVLSVDAQEGVATDTDDGSQIVDISDTGILPTNPFYFLKEWGRGLRGAIIFDPVKRLEFDLRIATEKAGELGRVSEVEGNESAIRKATENYEHAMERLRTRLEGLKETSANPEVDRLLENLTDRITTHQGVLDNVASRFGESESVIEIVRGASEKIGDVIRPVIERIDSPEKFQERVERIANQSGSDRLRLLRIIDTASSAVDGGDLLDKLAGVRDQVLSRIKETDLSADTAKRMLEEAQSLFAKLQQYVLDNNLSDTRLETTMREAKAHIDAGVIALTQGKTGEAFGQANAAIGIIKDAVSAARSSTPNTTIDDTDEDQAEDRSAAGVHISDDLKQQMEEAGRAIMPTIGVNPVEHLGELRDRVRIRLEEND